MSMGRAGVGRQRAVDAATQRELNAQAPAIPNLGPRIMRLFRPYRGRIAWMVVLVIVGASVAVVPALIIQRIFDDALFPKGAPPDLVLLAQLVGFMIALYIANAALSVLQTWLTSSVGNSVTGDLRVELFEHLQRMDLSFFTRTKTG